MRASLVPFGRRWQSQGQAMRCAGCGKPISRPQAFLCDKVLRKPTMFEDPKTCDAAACMSCKVDGPYSPRDPERSRRHYCPQHASKGVIR